MAHITIEIPDDYVGTGYDEPQYVVLVTAHKKWSRPEFAALLLKPSQGVNEAEEIGEDTSVKGLLTYAASVIYKENRWREITINGKPIPFNEGA